MTNRKDTNCHPDHSTLTASARALIEEQFTMTLATALEDIPWSSPVYYAYIAPGFYFFSSPDSRHIKNAPAGKKVSASIYADASSWQQIRGIQMAGQISQVPLRIRSAPILKSYITKFPTVKEMINTETLLDPDSFSKKFRVKLYVFQPELIYYMDNRISFGFRERVILGN